MQTLNIHQSNTNIKKYLHTNAFLQTYASRQRIIEACYLLFLWGEIAQEIGPKSNNSLNISVVKKSF
jgi:hypothetical protein